MTYGPPASLETFDRWVAERLLNPASAIFREGNLLLREEAALTDPTPYHAVLTAIAGGATRRSEIAGLLSRPATGVGHLLEGLEQVFEDLAREWCVSHAHGETLGGEPNQVLPAVAPCRAHGQGHELDVVVIDHPANQPRRVVAIGEAKATSDPVDQTQLRRLEHLRDLVPATLAPAPARLLLFSRSGFAPELRREAAGRADIELVDLDFLYHGA